MAKLDTYINIDVNGTAAVTSLGKVENAVKGVDSEVDKTDQSLTDMGSGDQMSGLDVAFEGLKTKLGAMAGPAGAGALVAGLWSAGQQFADTAIEASTLATALDTSVEMASALNAAFGDVGIEMNDIADIALQITGAIQDDADLAAALGVKVGTVLEPVEALRVGIDRWDFLSATQRSKAFGEEGIRQISRMISEGETFEEIINGVNPVRIIDEREAEKAREFQRTVSDVKGIWEAMVITVGQEVVGAINDATTAAEFLGLEGGNTEDAFKSLSYPLQALLNPIGLAVDGIQALGGETDKITPAAQAVADHVTAAFEDVTDAVEDTTAAEEELGEVGENAGASIIAAMKKAGDQYDWLTGHLNDTSALANLKLQFIDTFDTAYEENKKTEEGLLRNEVKINDLTRALADYMIEVLGIPVNKTTELILEWAGKTPEEVQAELAKIERFIKVTVALGGVPLSQLPANGPGVVAPTNTITNNISLSRTMGAKELAATLDQWSIVNG